MNIRLTGDPKKADRIKQIPRTVIPDRGDLLTREAPASGSFSVESLEIEAVIATRHPVTRRDARGLYIEILDPAGLVLSGDDWPLLADHRPTARETIGRVHDVRIDGDTVLARLRFSGADDLLPIRQRVQDGTLRAFSAGYSVETWAEGKDATGQRTKTATRWHLKEVSLVAIPADPNATRRSESMPFDIQTRNALIDTLRGACNLSDEWGADLDAEAVTDNDVRKSSLSPSRRPGRTCIFLCADLKALLNRLPLTNLTFLMTAHGQPFVPAGFTNWFHDMVKEAGLPAGLSPHGQRCSQEFGSVAKLWRLTQDRSA